MFEEIEVYIWSQSIMHTVKYGVNGSGTLHIIKRIIIQKMYCNILEESLISLAKMQNLRRWWTLQKDSNH